MQLPQVMRLTSSSVGVEYRLVRRRGVY